MIELIVTVGLKLIGLFFSNESSKEKAKKRFLDFISQHAGDSAIPVGKRQEYLELKKKLEAEKDSAV